MITYGRHYLKRRIRPKIQTLVTMQSLKPQMPSINFQTTVRKKNTATFFIPIPTQNGEIAGEKQSETLFEFHLRFSLITYFLKDFSKDIFGLVLL